MGAALIAASASMPDGWAYPKVSTGMNPARVLASVDLNERTGSATHFISWWYGHYAWFLIVPACRLWPIY